MPYVGAAAAVVGTTYGIVAGERGENQQTMARRRQQEAQKEALRIQMAERTRSVQADQKANRPSPASTVGGSLGEMLAASGNQPGPIDDRLKLSRPTKLGGG
jgi:hypothetical protein